MECNHFWVKTCKEPTVRTLVGEVPDPPSAPSEPTYIQHETCEKCKATREIQMPAHVLRI